MRRALCLCASLAMFPALASGGTGAARFPIRNADAAITLAKAVCLRYGSPLLDEDMNETAIRKAMPTLKWGATLQDGHWFVDTMPSVVAGTNDHLLIVDIPVEGPVPKGCPEAGYSLLLGLPPRPPKPRPACEPSDISEPDAQQLALEAVAPDGGVWLMASRAQSQADAWIVSVRIPERPQSDADADKGEFKVFKRTADVLNTHTGERFTALPSKAQFVEHHCLDKH